VLLDDTRKLMSLHSSGFQNAGVPIITKPIASALASWLPVVVIVLLIEHIAISKSFGRVNNYVINPSQEMVAIGVTNLLGPFLGAYPATGSFSRTAIKSKAGVRTPFAGVITAIVVLLAIYALPAVFFYIPNAALAAVIIHAVGDLITPPNVVYSFWRVSPFEVVIFFVGVLVTVFNTIENGIYCTVIISAAMLLYRILKAKGRFLGRVKVHSLLGDRIVGDEDLGGKPPGEFGKFNMGQRDAPTRSIYIPIDHEDGSNPAVHVSDPYPGVFIYRFEEGFSYPNASHALENLTEHIFKVTRRTDLKSFERPGDRPWNNPGPSRREIKRAIAAGLDPGMIGENPDFPTLKAVIFDCSSVNNLDVTSVQMLIDVRNQLDRYAAPDVVDWHFANVQKRWAKRALIAGGFGYPSERPDGAHTRWKPIFSLTDIGGSLSAVDEVNTETDKQGLHAKQRPTGTGQDIEAASSNGSSDADPKHARSGPSQFATVHSITRPMFHIDLTSALQSAILNVQAREESSTGFKSQGSDVLKA
jgi:solute carrier family 26 (sodium-independent sulfate anion transporter), member 11